MRPRPAPRKPTRPEVFVVGIAGPSGSGKTTLAQAIARRAKGVVFALDAYYRDQGHLSEDEVDVDIPDAIEACLAAEHLRELVGGRSVNQPVYDYATHSRTPHTLAITTAPVIVVEGLFALYWSDLRDLMHAKAFIALDHDECLRRRLERDLRERRRGHDEVVSMYERKVRPMYDTHVEPTRGYADVVLDGRATIDELARALLATLRST